MSDRRITDGQRHIATELCTTMRLGNQLTHRSMASIHLQLGAFVLTVSLIAASCSKKPGDDQKEKSRTDLSPAETNGRAAEPERPNVNGHPREADADSSDAEGETELQPEEDKVAEDCVAFLRATEVVPAQTASSDCPTCPAPGTEVLRFQSMKTDGVFCSAISCEVVVTIRAFFNPGAGESLGGGLTAWIPPEQRAEYLRGNTPPGEQVYRVKITYRRAGEAWRAVEFDRADSE
jgi:hypothetical protein